MKELKVNKRKFLWITIFFLLIGCMPLINLKKRYYYRKGKELCELCNAKYAEKDTVLLNEKMVCIFENKNLKRVGKLKDGRKKGYWYFYSFYSKNKELDMVIKYKKEDSTIVWSRGAIFPKF